MTTDEKGLTVREKSALPSFNLTPKSLDEALKLAELMAKSDLVPKDYRDKPGNVLIAVQMGAEVGLSPMAAIQNIAVVNGRPSLWGDAGKALLLSAGIDIDEADAKEIRESGIARCTITRPGHTPVTRTFSLEDAKRAGLLNKDTYKNYPERMLAWRAFWFAARDAASDILKGLSGAEEAEDMPAEPRNITPTLPEREHPPVKLVTVTKDQPAGDAPKSDSKPNAETASGAAADESRGEDDALGAPADILAMAKEFYALAPKFNKKVNEQGAANRLLREIGNVDSPTKLTLEKAATVLEKMRQALAA